MGFVFEFNPAKAANNLKKHGVSFAEAMTVFDNPLAQTFPNELHSEDEDRCLTIGLSSQQRLLFISPLEEDNRIRLIWFQRCGPSRRSAEREANEQLKRRP